MKLHTKLGVMDVEDALATVKSRGHVAADVEYAVLTRTGSRSHFHAFELQLGTRQARSLPAGYVDRNGHAPRRRRMSSSAHAHYGATWHEHGYLIAEIFKRDPGAKFTARLGNYDSAADFTAKTDGRFPVHGIVPGWGYWTWEHEGTPCPAGPHCPHKTWHLGDDE